MEAEFAARSLQIGSRLRAERLRRGWSLNNLSSRTSGRLSKSRISNYEQGIRRMGLEAAELLAVALGTVTPGWLLLLDEEPPLSDEEFALVQAFRALSPERRQELLATTRVPDAPVVTPARARGDADQRDSR